MNILHCTLWKKIILIKHMFDCSIITGLFPKAWKQGTVIPIPKVVNHQVPSELRPITLFPLPGKMLQRLVHKELSPYLEENSM